MTRTIGILVTRLISMCQPAFGSAKIFGIQIRSLVYPLFLVQALQGQNGAVSGVVNDDQQKPVPRVAIEVRNDTSGARFKAESTTDGRYTLTNVPAGLYTLSAFVPGMTPYQQPNLSVVAGQTLRVDFRMDDFNSNTAGEDRDFYANLWYPKVQKGPTPRAAGKPDLSAVWRPNLPSDVGMPDPLPWAAAKAKELAESRDLPSAHCLPHGMDLATLVAPIRIVQTPKLLLILFEGDLPRQIYLDGRSHPKEYPLLTWAGHSIGRWKGDTLVVDSRGFNDKSVIGTPFHPHTEQLHMTERMRRVDLGHLEIETTVEDPGTFRKPWVYKKVLLLAPAGEDVEENICNENERDRGHYVGK